MQRIALFKQAWLITWHHKALWAISLFGSVAFFVYDALFRPKPTEEIIFIINWAVYVIVLFLTTAFVSGALMILVNSIADHETITLGGGFRAGLRWVLPLTLMTIILMLPVWLILYNPAGTLLTIFADKFAAPDSVPVTGLLNNSRFISVSPYGFILAVTLVTNGIGIGAERSVVLESRSILVALKRGVQLLIKRIGDFLVVGLVLLGFGLVISAIFLSITGPLVEALALLLGEGALPLYFTSPMGLLFTVADFLICAVFTVFASSVWTLAFREWQKQEQGGLAIATEQH